VHITAQREGNYWRIAIRDNGIGISQEHLDKVFGLFHRLHNQAQYPGTGIGLASCKRIIEQHGGRIGVESVPGQGSTFYFTLPAAHAEPEPSTVKPAAKTNAV
jgi:signal transduction histidine kinase